LLEIENHEGYRELPYDNDGGGNCTIGYGHLLHKGPCTAADRAKYPNGMSPAAASAQLASDVAAATLSVNRCVHAGVSQQQFDQLVDFAFNVGGTAFCDSTLVTLLNTGDYRDVPAQMARWKYSSGHVVQGLINRRGDTGRLFGKLAPRAGTCVINCGSGTATSPSGPAPINSTTTSSPGTGTTTTPAPPGTTYELDLAEYESTANANNIAGLGSGTGAISITYSGKTTTCGFRSSGPQDLGSCGSLQIPAGSSVTATATPTDDSTFVGWSASVCGAQENPCTFTMNDQADLTANFGVSTYFITITNADKSEGQVLKSGGAAQNAVCGLGQDQCSEVERSEHPVSFTFVGGPGYAPDMITGCDYQRGQSSTGDEAFCSDIATDKNLTISVTWKPYSP
jgi:GH24 family phage-related lysozyme (muramidase)